MHRRRPLFFFHLILLSSVFFTACHAPEKSKLLENANLSIRLSTQLPLISTFSQKQSGISLQGDSGSTGWSVNGILYPWRDWIVRTGRINQEDENAGIVYHMNLPALPLSFDYSISLTPDAVLFSVSNVIDSNHKFISLGWGEKTLLHTNDSLMHWWTRQTALYKPFERKRIPIRGLWTWDEFSGRAGDSVSCELGVDACLWRSANTGDSGKHVLAAGFISNTDLFPVRVEGGPGKGFSLGLNTYYYRLEGQVRPGLQAKLLLTGDLNGDGLADNHDYFYWRNRQLPDVPDYLKNSISYKVFMDRPDQSQPTTTLDQLDKMVAAINHITDGIPQIAYLVGWQYKGHDTGYPALDRWNERLGPHKTIYEKSEWYRDHLNTILAFNYNKYWNSQLMATDFDKGPMYWQMSYRSTDSNFHISHYKDVQSGAVFNRLSEFLKTVPVQKIIHLDAMRSINCNPEWEKDSIGVREELDLGLKPIMHWLKEKGIEVTTEGQNGNPHEMIGLVAGVYHMDDPSEASLMLYHRKFVGGGFGEGRGRYECGLGTNLHEDLAFRKIGQNLSFTNDWEIIKERIYLGSLLYLYYLQRQIVNVKMDSEKVSVYYDDSTVSDIDKKQNHLLVHRGKLVIARDDDRFIPLGKTIYALSKTGSTEDWVLPPDFAGQDLEVYSLSAQGRNPATGWKIKGNSIRLELKAGVPEIIVKSKK